MLILIISPFRKFDILAYVLYFTSNFYKYYIVVKNMTYAVKITSKKKKVALNLIKLALYCDLQVKNPML